MWWMATLIIRSRSTPSSRDKVQMTGLDHDTKQEMMRHRVLIALGGTGHPQVEARERIDGVDLARQALKKQWRIAALEMQLTASLGTAPRHDSRAAASIR